MLNQQIKGNLAKLLATENLVVEHRGVPTASFDVERRVLTLPKWDKASNTVYDMLVGHEVGHALFTPNEDWSSDELPVKAKSFVNVVEDVRIEKLMKRKYPGLRKSFAGGYAELNALDFFEIEDKDLTKFSLIDRINLHFKVGANALIPFSNNEKVYVQRAEQTETFADVLDLAKELYNLDAEVEQSIQEQIPAQQDEEGEGEDEQETQTESSSDNQDDQEYQSTGSNSISQPNNQGGEEEEDDLDCGTEGGEHSSGSTQDSFDEKASSLSSQNYGNDTTYVEIPETVNVDKVVVDWKKVHSWIDQNNQEERIDPYDSLDSYATVDAAYKEFRDSNKKEVNYLVKEFECKKSAAAYARSSTARTGVLDTTKLHTYKYNEDLFKRVSVVPDGKNHGMIFIIDWSGSMQYELLATVKQLLNLSAFCRKVQIPFEVYAFTNEWQIAERAQDPQLSDSYDRNYWYGNQSYRNKENLEANKIQIPEGEFHLINFVSSRSNAKEFEKQCRYLFREAYCYTHRTTYYPTPGLGLSGTPLNEAVIMLNYILPKFKRENDLQKVNVCILTDGEANGSAYGRTIYNHKTGETHVSLGRIHSNCSLRDRKTGIVYANFDDYYTGNTNTFIDQVRDRFPEVNIIGFRILPAKKLSEFVSRSGSYEHYSEIQKQWKKTKSAIIPFPKGYSALYAISSKDLEEENEFDVATDATKGQITKAFKKMLKSKSTNKVLLNSFVDHVA
tara:strand:+ start:286 stop:2475 length:2190 start_codon:yes stop_codon:yes gene_type:complete